MLLILGPQSLEHAARCTPTADRDRVLAAKFQMGNLASPVSSRDTMFFAAHKKDHTTVVLSPAYSSLDLAATSVVGGFFLRRNISASLWAAVGRVHDHHEDLGAQVTGDAALGSLLHRYCNFGPRLVAFLHHTSIPYSENWLQSNSCVDLDVEWYLAVSVPDASCSHGLSRDHHFACFIRGKLPDPPDRRCRRFCFPLSSTLCCSKTPRIKRPDIDRHRPQLVDALTGLTRVQHKDDSCPNVGVGGEASQTHRFEIPASCSTTGSTRLWIFVRRTASSVRSVEVDKFP